MPSAPGVIPDTTGHGNAESARQMWIGDYTLSAATRKHLERENEVMKTILTDLGLIKQP